jgi:hypothetical protein
MDNHVEGHSNHAIDTQSWVGHVNLTVEQIVSVSMDEGMGHAYIV